MQQRASGSQRIMLGRLAPEALSLLYRWDEVTSSQNSRLAGPPKPEGGFEMAEEASGARPRFTYGCFPITQSPWPGSLIEVDAEGDLQD